jgi:hypothetical protein
MTANFNLSSWALRHRALVWFLMVIVATAGSYSYWRLGRSEDPPFTTKTMIVRVDWPGATVSEMLDQVTDRVEEELQETPHLDYLRSFTTPGETTIFVNLLSSTPALAVPDVWYQVHKKIGDIRWTLPPGIVGPFFNDEFGDTYGIIYAFTADGSPNVNCAITWRPSGGASLPFPMSRKSSCWHPGQENLHRVFTGKDRGSAFEPPVIDRSVAGTECCDPGGDRADSGRDPAGSGQRPLSLAGRSRAVQFCRRWPVVPP